MYTVDGLRNGILNCKKNIDLLEHAIKREKATIADYRCMIRDIEKADKIKAEAEQSVEVIYENGSS